MESISLHTLCIPLTPFFSNSTHSRMGLGGMRKRRFTAVSSSASKRDAYNGKDNNSNLVDENMIVLRKRIREMRMVERNDDEPPANWMQWEKQAYKNYDSDVCEAVGLLQTQLMNTRPCLVLVVLAVITFSVNMSMATIVFHLMQLAEVLLAANSS